MSEIPDDIQRTAIDLLPPTTSVGDIQRAIARAIMAERERCAELAQIHGARALLRISAEVRTSKARRDQVAHTIDAAEEIAAAIRAGGN